MGTSRCQNNPELNLPNGEDCVNSIEEDGKLLCVNTFLKPDDPNYQYDRFLGHARDGSRIEDRCTNNSDAVRFQNEFIETKKKYLICKKYPKKCQ